MAAERQSPDAVISSAGLDVSGGVSVIQNDPDSPAGTWFTTTGSNGSLRVSFPTPTGNPNTGAGLQEFRVRLRKDATGGGTPTYSAELRETGGGTALQTLATDVNIDTTDPGAVVSLTWDASNLGTADGSAVELLLTFSKGGGGPNERNVEVESAEWNVDYSTAGPSASGGSSASVSVTAAGAGRKLALAGAAVAVAVLAVGGGAKAAPGGAGASVAVSSAGAGAKGGAGGAGASVDIVAVGGGQGGAPSGGSAAAVDVSSAGGGAKAAVGGSGASVAAIATGAGGKASSGSSGASVAISTAGAGDSGRSGGAGAIVAIMAAGDGERASAGGSAGVVAITAAGAGSKQTGGGAGASVEVVATGGGSAGGIQGGSQASVQASAVGAGEKALMGGAGASVVIAAEGGGGMADPNRTTRSFAYAVEASAYGVRNTRSFAYAVEGEGAGVGDPPTIRVGNIRETTADLAVDPLSEYLEVRFQTRLLGLVIDDVAQVGSTRWVRALSGLTAATTYVSRARVRRTAGWSPWSTSIEWTTVAPGAPVGTRGCPPDPLGYFQNPDANPPAFNGRGFYHPLPGEPLRGVETVVLRHNDPAWLFDVYISDDLGVTYTLIQSDLGPAGILDGDQLELYTFELDTALYANGMDYRLKAVSAIPGDDEEYESLSFPINNVDPLDAAYVHYWDQRKSSKDRFGVMWAQQGASTLFGVPNKTIWVRGYDGGIGALANHDWSALVDRDCPSSKGADTTVRWMIWSGEGGLFALQGRDDCEGLHVGPAMFANGLNTADKKGIVGEFHNPLCWPLGCCDDVYTSTTARTNIGIPAGSDSLGGLAVESGGTSLSIAEIAKAYFKAVKRPFWAGRPLIGIRRFWRDGPNPGDNPTGGESCARRWEVYAQRMRVQEDPGDPLRVNVQYRIDGPGIAEPDSGYWHFDEWLTLTEELECGLNGFFSQQTTSSLYGGVVTGARVFLSSSIQPLDVCGEVEVEPIELPIWNPPVEGEPCTLVLQVYQEDKETLAWEVGTDGAHPNPYLCLPEHYGEQEIDVIAGAATIGQVEVVVIDKAQTSGDQDSGWLTERLSDGAGGIIHGFRCRLIRFISPDLGWVVIADGPASAPRMDDSYSGYRWTIRDTRETERKVRAFDVPDETWLAPVGYVHPWGLYSDPATAEKHFLVEPVTALVGTFRVSNTTNVPLGFVDLTDYWPGPFGGGAFPFSAVPIGTQTVPDAVVIGPGIWPDGVDYAEIDIQGTPYPVLWTWPDLEFLWRPAGSEDAWTVIDEPSDLLVEGRDYTPPPEGGFPRSLISGWNATDSAGRSVIAVTFLLLQGYQAEGVYPTHLQEVEIAYRYKGPTTPRTPHHLQLYEDPAGSGLYTKLTAGRLLKRLYDGLYSPRDPLTGAIDPSGIRYDEAALLQMADLVLLRVTEPVEDLREWAERMIYAPTGWVPALDNDGRISPVSQVPPDDLGDPMVPVPGSGGFGQVQAGDPAIVVGGTETPATGPDPEPPLVEGPGTYPHQPAGYTEVWKTQGNESAFAVGAWTYSEGWGGNVEVVDDPTNPAGTGKAMVATWPPGENAAGIANLNDFPTSPQRELYIMYRVMYDPDRTTNSGKQFYLGIHNCPRTAAPTQMYFVSYAGAGDGATELTQQNVPPTSDLLQCFGACPHKLANGVWQDFELQLVAQSSPSVADGIARLWVNGEFVGQKINCQFVRTTDPDVRFDGIHWYFKQNATNPGGAWERIGEFYVSGKP